MRESRADTAETSSPIIRLLMHWGAGLQIGII